jgi:hypothetical protein
VGALFCETNTTLVDCTAQLCTFKTESAAGPSDTRPFLIERSVQSATRGHGTSMSHVLFGQQHTYPAENAYWTRAKLPASAQGS